METATELRHSVVTASVIQFPTEGKVLTSPTILTVVLGGTIACATCIERNNIMAVKGEVTPGGRPQPEKTFGEPPAALTKVIARRNTGPPIHPSASVIEQRLTDCGNCQRFNGRMCRLVAGCGAVESWATRILYGCRNYLPRS